MDNIVNALVTQMLQGAMEYMRMQVKQSGLGNWSRNNWQLEYVGETPELLSFKAFFEKLEFSGLSKFQVHKLEFNSEEAQFAVDISIPQLKFTLGNTVASGKFFGNASDAQVSGLITIVEPRFTGKASLNLSDDGTIVLSYINGLDFQIKSIQSQLKVIFNKINYSEKTNHFLQNTASQLIKKFSFILNLLFETIIEIVVTNHPSVHIQAFLNTQKQFNKEYYNLY